MERNHSLQSRGGEVAHDKTHAHKQEVVCEMELACGKTNGDGIMILFFLLLEGFPTIFWNSILFLRRTLK